MRASLTLLVAFQLFACRGANKDGDVVLPDAGLPSAGTGSQTGSPTTPEGLIPAERPSDPTFPAVIDRLSIAIRTGDGTFDGTSDNTLSLCLTATDCLTLNTADVDDFQRSGFDVYHRAGLGLARTDVDRVELRSASGADMWRPGCLELRFDGEPVYCREAPGDGLGFGDGAGELTSWIDPDGVHNDCTTCYPTTLTHGPMLGAITADTARVFVRTDATRTVGLRMGETADLSAATVVAWAQPSPADDYTATLTATVPAGDWHYGIEVDGVLLEQSALRTAPTEPGPLRIAMGSCSKDDDQSLYGLVDSLNPDVFLMLGDNHYANSSDLDGLRWFYRWSLDRPERATLLEHTAIAATWDDHDYVGNNTDGFEPGKVAALKAFNEYWANPNAGLPGTPGVFTTWRYGDVEFFFVDGRSYRGIDGQFLGDAQTSWLIDALSSSDATFKFVACGSRWTEEGSDDSWASFLTARDALFAELASRDVQGLVLLSGDIHRSELRWVNRASAYNLPEITSSPMAHSISPCRNDEALVCYSGGNSFVSMDVDTAAADPSITATVYDAAGQSRGALTVRRSQLQ